MKYPCALTGEVMTFIESGIIDPVKVTKSSLQTAVSVASLILTAEAIIVEDEN